MLKSYEQLSKELNLSLSYENESQLNKLREWCGDNFLYDFSTLRASPQEEYQLLQRMAREYFDDFIPKSGDLNAPNPNLMNNYTPIEYAAYEGYVGFLTQHFDNLNPKNKRTPLHLVASLGSLAAVRQLLNKGAHSMPDHEGMHPVHLTLGLTILEQQQSSREQNITNRTAIYRLLKDKIPESIKESTKQARNVAHYMAIYGFDKLLTELVAEKSELLIARDFEGNTPAHLAILNGQKTCLSILLTDERFKRLADSKGTLLHFAADTGTKEDIIICLEAGIQYDIYDMYLQTPAMRAILSDNANALSGFNVDRLLEERIGESEQTLLHYAVQNNKHFCEQWLSKHTTLNEIQDKNGKLPNDYSLENYYGLTTRVMR